MHEEWDYAGATPGVPDSPVLTPEPLGTTGQLSPGPDHLRPEVPEERRELKRMGYLPDDKPDEIEDMGVMDDRRPAPGLDLTAMFGPPPKGDKPPWVFE